MLETRWNGSTRDPGPISWALTTLGTRAKSWGLTQRKTHFLSGLGCSFDAVTGYDDCADPSSGASLGGTYRLLVIHDCLVAFERVCPNRKA